MPNNLNRTSMVKVKTWLDNQHYVVQVITFLSFTYFAIILYAPIEYLTGVSDTDSNISDRPHGYFFAVVVVAPLVETLIFQSLLQRLMLHLCSSTRNKIHYTAFIVAVAFSLTHYYSIQYILFAFLVGLCLNYTYLYYMPNHKKAFWTVVLVHALRNGIAWWANL